MFSRWSELESNRFHLDTYRFEADEVSEPLLSAIGESNADLVILRVPASELKNVHMLRALGAHPLVADTLVYYTFDCSRVVPSPASYDRTEIRAATRDDARSVELLCAEIFHDYENHYASNPLLHRDVVSRAYAEWASDYVAQNDDSRQCWVATVRNRIVALATTRVQDDSCEIVLNGVSKSLQGQGIYRALVAHVQGYARSLGCATVFSSTQIGNLAPQRVWAHQGFLLSKAVNTIHLNLLMSTRFASGQRVRELHSSGGQAEATQALHAHVHEMIVETELASDATAPRYLEFFATGSAQPDEAYQIRSLVHSVPAQPEHRVLTVDVRTSRGTLIACGRSFPSVLFA